MVLLVAWTAKLMPLPQGHKIGSNLVENRLPRTHGFLPIQTHRWVPWATIPFGQPAPIGNIRQQDPDWLAERRGEMSGRSIDSDHQIKVRNRGCRLAKVREKRCEIDHVSIEYARQVRGPRAHLQAEKAGPRCIDKIRQMERTQASIHVVALSGVSRPDDTNLETRPPNSFFPVEHFFRCGCYVTALRRDRFERSSM